MPRAGYHQGDSEIVTSEGKDKTESALQACTVQSCSQLRCCGTETGCHNPFSRTNKRSENGKNKFEHR